MLLGYEINEIYNLLKEFKEIEIC